MNIKNMGKKSMTFAAIAGSMLIGGLGGTLLNAIQVSAQTPTPTPTTVVATPSPNTANSGTTFKSNEDPAHEAKESPEKEALEDAGKMNHKEDPTQEANEAPGTETQDDAGQAPVTTPPSTQ